MDLPPPPKDTGLRNIIDKLAEFVARNGPEFESITKVKQQGNPKFSFLYGGEHYHYYQWRVSTEQAILKQQGSISQAQNIQQTSLASGNNPMLASNLPNQIMPNQMWNNGPVNHVTANPMNTSIAQLESLNLQQITLREQIVQSEQNLTAQHGVLLQQQQSQIDDAILKAQHDDLVNLADDNNIRLAEFDAILQPIIESCTKDSISAGKNWILQHTTDPSKCNVILQYLLKKALANGAPFTQKLYLIYLVNDVLHHCARKRADDLKNNLENIVIPMFCSGQLVANDDQQAKLTKLLSLWESKANFFDACVISKLQAPASSMQEYKENLRKTYATVVQGITQNTKTTFESYKQQHQAFVQHATQQIALIESQKKALEQQAGPKVAQNQIIPPLMPPGVELKPLNNQNYPNNSLNNGSSMGPANSLIVSRNDRSSGPPPLMSQQVSIPGINMPALSPVMNSYNNGNNASNIDLSSFTNPDPPPSLFNLQPNSNSSNFALPPPNFLIPDLSKPPPGFSNPPAPEVVVVEEVVPSAPYYELPAGLMVPLIRLEDCNYRPLDPDDLRLPPPMQPSERLLSAIEAFYSLPSHDRPRDGEGWEKLGLYEYYKVKNAARKEKEEEIEKRIRDRSRSPSPIVIEIPKMNKLNKRRYRSKSRSKTRSKSRSRSKSPETRKSRKSNRFSRSPKKSSPSQSRRSPSPPQKRDRDRDRKEQRASSRSPPPSFFAGNFPKQSNECIEESNKGHQMLMRMGWGGSGTGLGSHGQGIDTPISGGEVRDRQDQFKGVGINLNDPYENFRKNKGAAFIHRMRSRDHDRKSKNHSPEPK